MSGFGPYDGDSIAKPRETEPDSWHGYWRRQGQGWRTQPEISPLRQELLTRLLHASVDEMAGKYPFRDPKTKLDRADVEWLLKHTGPIDGKASDQASRQGLDFRGASLKGLDLHGLPLAGCLLCGADLTDTNLERADLEGADLRAAELNHAVMREADLYRANLDGAVLFRVDLSRASLVEAKLRGTDLSQATLRGTNLREADLGLVVVDDQPLKEMQVLAPDFKSPLLPADLRGAFLDSATVLDQAILGNRHRGVALVDIRFGGVGLGAVDWTKIGELGDEAFARDPIDDEKLNRRAKRTQRDERYRDAIRANLQLSVALREQGLIEESRHFMHQARGLQRKTYLRHWNVGAFLFSSLMNALTGDGAKVRYLVGWYFVILLGFAEAYYELHTTGTTHMQPVTALYMSAVALHRLSFNTSPLFATSRLVILGAIESLLGLIVEAGLISAFTFRLLGH